MRLSVRRSLFVYFSATNVNTLLEVASSMVLARLLTPAEIGVYSVASVLVGIVHVLRNFGTGTYIVQEKELTPERLRSAFGVTLAASWVLGLLMFLSSDAVAGFYREPGVREVMLLLTVNMMLIPFGSITLACLQREMRFGVLSMLDLIATIASIAVSVTLALLDFGYMSLAWGSLAGIVVTIIGASRYRPDDLPWLPGFAHARRVMGFGAYATGAGVVGTIGTGTAEIILGRMIGMESVGLWSRAGGIVRIFSRVTMRTVSAVALPYFSQQNRAGVDLKVGFLKTVTYLTGTGWPFFAAISILAHPVVRLLYGPQWDASIPLVRIFCVGAALLLPFMLIGSVLLAAGKPKYNLIIELATLPAKAAVIILAAPWGLTAVALWSLPLAGVIIAINLYVLRITIGLRVRELPGALYRSAGVALVTAAGPALVWWLVPLDGWRPWIVLALGAPAGGAGWLVGLWAFGHPLWDELLNALRKLRESVG